MPRRLGYWAGTVPLQGVLKRVETVPCYAALQLHSLLRPDDGIEEFKKNLETKLSSCEEDIMSKKQRKFICDFKDYQSGRIVSFHRKYDHLYVKNEKESVIENNNRDFTSEVEESDVSDGSQSDLSDSLLEKRAAADKNLNKSNFFKQFRLLNQGRTDQRK
ncbi:hypothetical protein NDU88_006929 [Pleurodeles waltl]|uniref:Uncharacterized protein n=1 Tax=Pleurodeles waltl TaxID=8319 RepID=A0AAV7N2T6_PLEWA|nr:hypothetical protein NDU88_006929 [Pleurodeles waltl]